MKHPLIILLCITYLVTNIWVGIKIKRADYISEQRRSLHGRLIWLLPFLGAFITRGFWKKNKETQLEVMTKSKRKLDKSRFHESGIGMSGIGETGPGF